MKNDVRRILIVGLGVAGSTHLEVLEDVPVADVVAIVDKDHDERVWFNKKEVPVYQSIAAAAKGRAADADLVVIATPTPTHAQMHLDAVAYLPHAEILVEKPAACNVADVQAMLSRHGDKAPVSVALHMAFAPEVSWAVGVLERRRAEFGAVVSIESWSADPYQLDLDSAEERLGNSWLDSGINALSVIDRFAKIIHRRSLRQIGDPSHSTFEGVLECEQDAGGEIDALVFTTWNAIDSARATRIRYASGAQLVMDHNSVIGFLEGEGAIAETFSVSGAYIGADARRASHYAAMYRSWLVDKQPIASADTFLRLHDLLLSPIDFARGSSTS